MNEDGGVGSPDGPGPEAGDRPASPRVLSLSWGSVETEVGTFRDAKLWPGGGRGWDWDETGTHHDPGIQVADVEELVDHGARVVVLSRGQQGRLGVPDETVATLEEAGATVEVHRTGRAVDRHNELVAAGRAVGALLHSTC